MTKTCYSLPKLLILLVVAVSVFVAIAISSSSPIAARYVTEIRGVWLTNVDSDILFSNSGLTQALDRLRNLNFNTIYPTVWQGGYQKFWVENPVLQDGFSWFWMYCLSNSRGAPPTELTK